MSDQEKDKIISRIKELVTKCGGNLKMPIPFKYSRGTIELLDINKNGNFRYNYVINGESNISSASLEGIREILDDVLKQIESNMANIDIVNQIIEHTKLHGGHISLPKPVIFSGGNIMITSLTSDGRMTYTFARQDSKCAMYEMNEEIMVNVLKLIEEGKFI